MNTDEEQAWLGILPDGTQTADPQEYSKEWGRLTGHLSNVLRLQVIAFDPGVMLYDPETRQTIWLPNWVCQRLRKTERIG